MAVKERRLDPPREFRVGVHDVVLRHCADLELEPDEQVTFITPTGTELDVVRKEWGYYATPSLNGRLAEKGLRAVLVASAASDRIFLLLVEHGRETEFEQYLQEERLHVVSWLDTDEAAEEAIHRLRGPKP